MMPMVKSGNSNLSRVGEMFVCVCEEQGKAVIWGLGPHPYLQDNNHIHHPHF